VKIDWKHLDKSYFLLIFLPAFVVSMYMHAAPLVQFILACAAIIPLAKLLGHATESIAEQTTENLGGLLNATFGNATELLIAFFALKAGHLSLVKASLTGSLLANVLLLAGLAMFLGGRKFGPQQFSMRIVGRQMVLCAVAVSAMLIPALFASSSFEMEDPQAMAEGGEIVMQSVKMSTADVEKMSIFIAIVMILTYFTAVFHSFKHVPKQEAKEVEGHHWSMWPSIALLAGSTLVIAWVSEGLVHSVEGVIATTNMSELFIGIVIIPIIGNAAEHITAVTVALKNKMDLSFSIAIGSSTQIALFVAPLLVLMSLFTKYHMDLVFTVPEIASVGMATLILSIIVSDGKTNWFEGVSLLAVYLILAGAFYFVPVGH